MLAGYGFDKVYNLSGGIRAWNGQVAAGPPDLNLDLIRGDETPTEVLALAYGMEDALGEFYRVVRDRTENASLATLVDKLASVEEKHKDYLVSIGRDMGFQDITRESLQASGTTRIMEGGFTAEQLLEREKSILESSEAMLDLAMMLEAQALDLYLRFAQAVQAGSTRDALRKIADEEKAHLAALGGLR